MFSCPRGVKRYLVCRTYFDNSGLRSRLQNCKISSESDQQSKSTANCRNSGGNPTKEVCLQCVIFLCSLFSLLSSISTLRNIVLAKQIEYLLFRTKMGLNILAVSEFLVKSLRILLAISRDSGNCEEHNKETISHEIKKGN